MNTKIKNFTDLNAWKEAHKLAIFVYKLTKKFPSEEKYSLIDQMRRCAISVGSNIAEGFSRFSKKEKIMFYFTSKGSLTELQNQLLLAKDVGYLDLNSFEEAFDQTTIVHKLINGLVRSSSSKLPDTRYQILDTKHG